MDSNCRFNAAQVKWTSLDISFTEADWTEFCETYQKSVILSRDRIIKLKNFHHSHLTPARMHKMGLSSSAECFRGCGQLFDFLHCYWSCPVVQGFWAEIGSFIFSALGLPNILYPKNCLGIFGDVKLNSYAKRLILYFYANKSLLLSWKGSISPMLAPYLKVANNSLPL